LQENRCMIGTSIAHYTVVEKLGKGGMNVIFGSGDDHGEQIQERRWAAG